MSAFKMARNKKGTVSVLISFISVYTISLMARPPKPEHLRRSKMLPIRFTVAEYQALKSGAKRLDVTVSEVLREGAVLFLKTKGKDGSRQKEKSL